MGSPGTWGRLLEARGAVSNAQQAPKRAFPTNLSGRPISAAMMAVVTETPKNCGSGLEKLRGTECMRPGVSYCRCERIGTLLVLIQQLAAPQWAPGRQRESCRCLLW